MSSLIQLDAGVQNYAWGRPASTSFVAKMKGLSEDKSGKKYAELWVGTHPSCPSQVKGEKHESLEDFLGAKGNAAQFFSPAHEASPFRGKVPFLLKILSVGTALSIQAHPDKELAAKLHAENPKEYKDANHKPELICALTPYEALCCFRPLKDILKLLHAVPDLAKLLEADKLLGSLFTESSPKLPEVDSEEEKKALKAIMSKLYSTDKEACTAALRANLERAKKSTNSKEDEIFIRTYGQYPDDVGCWMIYILNFVQLAPGEALFLSACEPHAYLSGEGVEIMAASDNVVRAGLTPKWKDVKTLVSMLKYDTTGLSSAHHDRSNSETSTGWQMQYYQPPKEFPDFSLYRFEYKHDDGNGSVSAQLPTIGLGFCIEGAATVNGSKVKSGDCFAVPYGKVTCEADGKRALIFIASTNDLKKSKV